jgi:hypothetical protein
MNRLIAPFITPCGSIVVRSKVTLPRRARTPEWHEAEKKRHTEKLDKLTSEHDLLKAQLKLLRDRLKDKNTVTSFRGVLVEKTLSKRVSCNHSFVLFNCTIALLSWFRQVEKMFRDQLALME